MKAMKILAITVVLALLLYVAFSFCYFSFDAGSWGAADRAFMVILWGILSLCSTGYLLELK